MEDLRLSELPRLHGKKRWRAWRIIEHHHNGKSAIGTVESGGANAGGDIFCVKWTQDGGGNRTTVFQTESWRREDVACVIYFRRTAEDTADSDAPNPDAFLYTLVPRVVEEDR